MYPDPDINIIKIKKILKISGDDSDGFIALVLLDNDKYKNVRQDQDGCLNLKVGDEWEYYDSEECSEDCDKDGNVKGIDNE